jgi:hypothetical protein
MAKRKPPAWLTTAFAEGVVELAPPRPTPAYKGALGRCWLAQHDERRRPCSGRLERAHLIPGQRVENALAALLPYNPVSVFDPGSIFEMNPATRRELILLAAWDPRNGIIACEGHHRRFDSHLTPALMVPRKALPGHAISFALDWGIEAQLDRFPD